MYSIVHKGNMETIAFYFGDKPITSFTYVTYESICIIKQTTHYSQCLLKCLIATQICKKCSFYFGDKPNTSLTFANNESIYIT